jgi:hypothetical protein
MRRAHGRIGWYDGRACSLLVCLGDPVDSSSRFMNVFVANSIGPESTGTFQLRAERF